VLPGDRDAYTSWPELRDALARALPRRGSVAMEHAPMGSSPDTTRIDAATLDLVRACGANVVGSDALVRELVEQMTGAELEAQAQVARALDQVVVKVFAHVGEALASGAPPTESALERVAVDLATARSLVEVAARICVGTSSADPTHVADNPASRRVEPGDVVRVEMIARERSGPFAEAGRVGWVGSAPPKAVADAFTAVRDARDAALSFLRERVERGRVVLGFEVDRTARDVIVAAGLGARFVHRLGEHVGKHGKSAHGTALDGLETDDTRPLERGHAWVLAPGVYFDDWGVRTTTLVQLREEMIVPVEPQAELVVVRAEVMKENGAG
jgi:Xaa-Pro aminopeptidase